jgi:hypothetical protein
MNSSSDDGTAMPGSREPDRLRRLTTLSCLSPPLGRLRYRQLDAPA